VKLLILAVGKLRDPWVAAGCAEYTQRLRPRLPVETVELKREADMLARIPPRYACWVLDERGELLTSRELSSRLQRVQHGGRQQPGLALCIGGPDGFPDEVRRRADLLVSLSRLTLPHRLARLILLEQLYRAASILGGEPYHRD
jgi:23S rRNA (pseudouridine1915-N3)-methyltransferase